MATANTFGRALQGQKKCQYQDDTGIMNGNQSCVYFEGYDTKQGEYAYRFMEYNPSDSAQVYPYLSNRTIRASAGQCYQYSFHYANKLLHPPNPNVHLLKFGNSSYQAFLQIPKYQAPGDSTLYIYNGTSTPQSATKITCGPRCMTMYALRINDGPTDPSNAIFECPISISNVSNAIADYQEVPDHVALIAASSIALTGRYTPDGKSWAQSQNYATLANNLGTRDDGAQQVGEKMAEFAIGALTGTFNNNPTQLVPGTLPILGYRLEIKWKYIIALAVCIGAVHFILIMLTVWISRPVNILDDSNLALARLLYGLVGRLGGRGSLLDGKQLADAIQASGSEGGQVVYGVRGEGQDRSVVLDEGVQIRRRLKGEYFPEDNMFDDLGQEELMSHVRLSCGWNCVVH